MLEMNQQVLSNLERMIGCEIETTEQEDDTNATA